MKARMHTIVYARTQKFVACMATVIYCYTHFLLFSLRTQKYGGKERGKRTERNEQQRWDCQKESASTIFHF